MLKHCIIKSAPTTALAFVAAVYFAIVCPYHFHFQEQYQLFLWTGDYARETMGVPGGLADYLGQFFTQFYYVHGVGPVILALCLALARGLLAANMRNRQTNFRYLSFIPIAYLWIYLQNDHALLGTGIAFILSLVAAWAVGRIKHPWVHGIVSTVMIPCLYWGVGTMVWLFTLIVVVHQFGLSKHARWVFMALFPILTGVLPWVASIFCPYPIEALAFGIHYFRFAADHPFLIRFIIGLSALVAVIPDFTIQRKAFHVALPVVSLLVAVWLESSQINLTKDETLAYSYWGRTRQWNAILAKANQQPPRTVVGVCMVNLALGMKGEMENHLMDYFQNGAGGLIPAVQNDFIMSPIAGEIYYQLGMTYLAQQQMMEAMEACPDMQKSAYIYQRLAETNLINGAYAVAYKYLKALQHTLFYKGWATETLQLLGNEEAINQHPEYGRLRRMAHTENRFAMGTFMELLQQMCQQNPNNQLAADYLKACLRLMKE